jgi:uncharacterized protein YabE (DUF348 family)
MSDDLFKGERGATGDHGQDGAKGATGATGASGKSSSWTWTRSLAGFLFVVAAFTLSVYIGQQNTLRIDRLAHTVCATAVTNADSFNAIIDQTIVSVRVSKVLTPAEKADRIKRYNAVKQVKPDCGDR